ncbi:septum formation family protein [Herbiconiux sp. CPCC 205716]|uniref:Septum formation family protein n=1 Tax=Herbiconiux gentiana TaxID=2970912 RepID=A0ABT2GD23_9MICO|nr:DUF4190 domain-containing protein [Herbiconiux gentiana]MCS5714119.1 septum formation family protein [Herbiconiux gentiana]
MSDSGSTPPPVPPTGGYGSTPPPPGQPPYGGPQGQPPSPYGAPQGQPPYYGPPQSTDFPGRTLGIVGLILSFFTAVVGLIISAIALSQSKKAGYKNGPALAGVIVGSVLSGLAVIVIVFSIIVSVTTSLAVIGVAAGAAGGASDDPSATAEPLPTAEPFPTTEPSPGDPGTGGGTDVFDLVVGDCFDEWDGDTVFEVPVVDCASPHDWEVYDDFEVPDTSDGTFPGEDKLDVAADDGCLTAFETFLGVSYADTIYDYSYLVPTEDSWTESDDRLVTCIITDPAGQVTGSLKGAGAGTGGGADSSSWSPR